MTMQGRIPVPAGSEREAFERGCAALDKLDRRERTKRVAITALAVLAIPGTLSGWLFRANFPLVQVREMHIPYGPHNQPLAVFDNAPDAAAAMTGDAALPAVWRFVRAMEGYDANTENEDWAVAVPMAAKAISETYKRERDPNSKASRFQRYEKRIRIIIERDTEIDVCDADRCDPNINGYAIKYHRVVWDNNTDREIERIPHQAIVRFRRNVPGFSYDHVRQFNPLRIQVVSYTKGQPLVPANTKYPG